VQGVPAQVGAAPATFNLNNNMTQILDSIQIETAPNPTAAVIFIHGLGDSGHGWSEIARAFAQLGAIRFVFPHANNMPVTMNNGMSMPSWYDIDLTQREREDESGLRASQAQIEALIEREKARGIPAHRIVIGGFSQGCVMALQTGLRHPEKLAGLMCLSGYLPLADKVADERHAAGAGMPIFMAHGRSDKVILATWGAQSRDKLVALGYQVEWHDYPMEHSSCMDEYRDMALWLKKILST
jgi:phospholipase/carboxylesterase